MGFQLLSNRIFCLAQLLFLLNLSSCTTINKPECGSVFTCPDNCKIFWSNACPDSCDCSIEEECPDFQCPANPPICIIYTKHNGCQSCACQAPYIFRDPQPVKKTTKPQTSTTTTATTNNTTTTTTITTTPTTTSIIPTATITTATSTTTTTIPSTTTTTTIPSTTTTTTRSPIPTTTTTPPQVTSRKTATQNNNIVVLSAALIPASVQTVSPIGSPSAFDNNSVKPAGLTLLQTKEDGFICDETLQKEVDKEFTTLFTELKEKSRSASLLYPAIFGFTKSEIIERCNSFRAASARLSFVARRNCYGTYDIYNTVYSAYNYACGYGTGFYFLRYFDCLTSLKIDPKVVICDAPAVQNEGVDMCARYNTLLNCIYEQVVRKCSYDGWEIAFQYLSTVVRRNNKNCELQRINLTVNLV